MKETNEDNPFITGGYVSDRYFCDRTEETKTLIKHVVNGRNVVLVSPRRLGKSGLIQHCFGQAPLKNGYHTFFVDIYATSSISEFVYLLSKEVFAELKPKKTQWKEQFFQIIRSLRPGFKLDAVSGEPTFDIGLGDVQNPEVTLDEIFAYLEKADKPCVVAIDEFQQISEYQEKNVEALLRTKMQRCRQTRFVFSGSKRHMMGNMFFSASRPFYQSAVSMGLEPIPPKTYCDFAVKLFEERKKRIKPEVVDDVYNRFEGCTWFVQMMMNELYALTAQGAVCGEDYIDAALKNIIRTQESVYKELLSYLAPRQRMVLQAIAKEGKARNVTSSAFVQKYNLGSASSVQSAVTALMKNDWLAAEDGLYRVYDYFLAEWLRSY